MVKEKFLISLILGLSIIGLLTLYLAISLINPVEIKIKDIKEPMTGNLVKITGKIESFKKSNTGNIYLNVSDDTGEITVPLIGNLGKKFSNITKGEKVEIVGIITEYKDTLEVLPRSEKDVVIG
jgi:DNA/RNA endonuclease YhcR with UshA esterase domain